jgi:hypothetical protein
VAVKPKAEAEAATGRLLEPDLALVDTPTSAVLDYGGYSLTTRFFSDGGVLQRVSFGVFHRLNLGASLNIDRLIGSDNPARVRVPHVEVRYRFYDGERYLPSLAVGFDGQGHDYNPVAKRYNNRHRGFFLVATQEVGVPGLMIHPSLNISDFDSNSIFGAIPASFNIQDTVNLMLEWDNINNFDESRLNAGARFYVTDGLHLDFALRGLGQGGRFSNGASRGPERIAQIKYTGNF